jgi:hypothetical protein
MPSGEMSRCAICDPSRCDMLISPCKVHVRDILLALGCDPETRSRITALNHAQLCEAVVGGFDLVVSRTGYTGERWLSSCLFTPAGEALFRPCWKREGFGLKPCGWGAIRCGLKPVCRYTGMRWAARKIWRWRRFWQLCQDVQALVHRPAGFPGPRKSP